MFAARHIPFSPAAVLAAALFAASGCATLPGGGELAAYAPAVDPAGVQLPDQESPAGAAVSQAARGIFGGDKLHISLRGIPNPEEIQGEVNEQGNITLPLVGPVKVAGLAPSEAERAIEKAFVDGGYYRKITVIVVAQDDYYFAQGEVRTQGRFPLVGEMTLLQAIAAAGGYTEYAKPSRVRIMRGDQILRYDAERISRRRDPDPLVKRGDIIVVERRVFL